eukprot:TRINITY_DN8608_c0_g1_i1.p1 TRINITY_DN8608_c0_g1~~TRINITY_DN8608_c0_g1_i1.p1  ORF type:complete len:380 (-),score=73.93 TRINITY_DN8608_c0_g1_i1:170-1309(-)
MQGAAVLFVIALVTLHGSNAQSVQCLDNNGNPVDWFFLYKLGEPVSPYSGYTYVYTDSNTDGQWKMGNFNNTNAVFNTVSQIGLYGGNSPSSDVGWALWNDQTYSTVGGKIADHESDGSGYIYGHTKGLIGFDSNTAFWITHSAPGFPFDHSISPSSWYFPHGQSIYAQNFFCVSIFSSNLDNIGSYLQYYHAYVYDSNVPSSANMPNFQAFTNDQFLTTNGSVAFTSLAGKRFLAVGKNQMTNSDLYEDYLAPALNTGLYVECWCGGTFGFDCMDSYCAGAPIGSNPSTPQSSWSSYPFDSVTVDGLNFNGMSFAVKYNHAKWAISIPSSSANWFCASDINRETTQRKRGGGAVCMRDPQLWNAMYTAITSLDTSCPN